MNDKSLVIADHSESVEAGAVQGIELTQELQPGRYWRAKPGAVQACEEVREDGIDESLCYLIREIQRIDGDIHSIVLLYHPNEDRDGHRTYTIDTFLSYFEPEPDGERIREREIAEAQGKVREIQLSIEEVNNNPSHTLAAIEQAIEDGDEEFKDLNIRAGLPESVSEGGGNLPSVANDIGRLQAQMGNQVALVKMKSRLLTERSEKLTRAAKAIAPFYEERSKAMLATTQAAMDHANKIMSGLHTLEMYTGKDIEVVEIKKGGAADTSVKLTVRQQILFMDEESLINDTLDGADFSDFVGFAKILAGDAALLNRMMPEQRCVIGMRYRRYDRDYKDAVRNMQYNEINKQSFLLIRNGENVHAVFSPLIMLQRLFPTLDDAERPFRGFDGAKINIKDVRYFNARKQFDNLNLLYKRLLILLWGLYDRTDVIGDFEYANTDPGFLLISADAQSNCFNLVADDDESIQLGESRPDFRKFARDLNDGIQPGSLVYINADRRGNEYNMSGIYTYNGYAGEYYCNYRLVKDEDIFIVESKAGKAVVKVLCRHDHTEREIHATLSLVESAGHSSDHTLCLDFITTDALTYYLESRQNRQYYLQFTAAFRAARERLAEIEAEESDLLSSLRQALSEGGITPEKEFGYIDSALRAVRAYRISTRWKPLPATSTPEHDKLFKQLLDQIWRLEGKGSDREKAAEEIARAEGRQPLRLTVTGKNVLVLYASCTDEEAITTLGPCAWVQRIVLEEGKRKVKVARRSFVRLEDKLNKETLLREWDEAAEYVRIGRPVNISYKQAGELGGIVNDSQRVISSYGDQVSDEEFDNRLDIAKWAYDKYCTGRYVRIPRVIVPVGVVDRLEYTYRNGEPSVKVVARNVLATAQSAEDWLASIATEAQLEKVKSWIRGTYGQPTRFVKMLGDQRYNMEFCLLSQKSALKCEEGWGFFEKHHGLWLRVGHMAAKDDPKVIVRNVIDLSVLRRCNDGDDNSDFSKALAFLQGLKRG